MTTNVVLYARSSKDKADISPAAQLRELREYASRKGYKVVGEFKDSAISANDSPPELLSLISEAEHNPQRGWDTIVATDSARIARDYALAGAYTYKLRKAGCRFEFSKQPSSGSAAQDVMLQAVMDGIASYHSIISKEKAIQGLKENVHKGWRAGGRPPYGYTIERERTGAVKHGTEVVKAHLVIDKEIGPRIKRYLKARLEGLTRTEAAQRAKLNLGSTTLIGIERNALCYAGCSVWNQRTAKRDRPAGAARYRPKEEWLIVEGTHPAMVSRKEAEALLKKAMPDPARKRRAAGAPSGNYALTGVLMTPAGEGFVGTDGKYYRTQSKGVRIPAVMLEAIVKTTITEDFRDDRWIASFVAELRKRGSQIESDIDVLGGKLKTVGRKIAGIVRVIEDGGSSTLVERLKELEAEKARIEDELARAEGNARLKAALNAVTERDARTMLDRLWEESIKPEELRAAILRVVDRIELDPATGAGRIFYRLALGNGAGKFNFHEESRIATEMQPKSGVKLASPRGFEPRLPP